MKPKKTFVLVSDDQLPISPQDAADLVEDRGARLAAQHLGFSEQTLRRFLAKNGYLFHRETAVTVTKQEAQRDDEARPTDDPNQLQGDNGGEGGVESERRNAAQEHEPVDA